MASSIFEYPEKHSRLKNQCNPATLSTTAHARAGTEDTMLMSNKNNENVTNQLLKVTDLLDALTSRPVSE